MFGQGRWNTILTTIEVRWIKNAYKKGTFGGDTTKCQGSNRLVKKINEGRMKAGLKPVSSYAVLHLINKIKRGGAIVPIDATATIATCPNCGHKWYKQKR